MSKNLLSSSIRLFFCGLFFFSCALIPLSLLLLSLSLLSFSLSLLPPSLSLICLSLSLFSLCSLFSPFSLLSSVFLALLSFPIFLLSLSLPPSPPRLPRLLAVGPSDGPPALPASTAYGRRMPDGQRTHARPTNSFSRPSPTAGLRERGKPSERGPPSGRSGWPSESLSTEAFWRGRGRERLFLVWKDTLSHLGHGGSSRLMLPEHPGRGEAGRR